MLVELAAAVRNGVVSPQELVEESLRRIEATHDDLNAVVRVHADEALAEARDHDRTGPLAGLPLARQGHGAVRGQPDDLRLAALCRRSARRS